MCYGSPSDTAAERRKQRGLMYDRDVVVKQINAAKAERDALLHQHRNLPIRRCSRCHEDWELLSTRFPKYKLASGGREVYRRTRRFCLRASARRREQAKKAMVSDGLPGETATPLAPTDPKVLSTARGLKPKSAEVAGAATGR